MYHILEITTRVACLCETFSVTKNIGFYILHVGKHLYYT